MKLGGTLYVGVLLMVCLACNDNPSNKQNASNRKQKSVAGNRPKSTPSPIAGRWVTTGQADTILKSQSLQDVSCPDEFIFTGQADSFLYVHGEGDASWYKFEQKGDSVLEVNGFQGLSKVVFLRSSDRTFSIIDSMGHVINQIEMVDTDEAVDSVALQRDEALVTYFMETVISGKYVNVEQEKDTVQFFPNGDMIGMGFSHYKPLTGKKRLKTKEDVMLFDEKTLVVFEKLGDVLVIYEALPSAKAKKMSIKRGKQMARLLFVPDQPY